MRRFCIPAVLLVVAAIGPGPAAGQDNTQVFNIPLSRPGEPMTLEIGILSARIEVIGEDREDAQFEVTFAEGNRKIVTPSGTRNISVGGYSLQIDEEDNTINLDTDWRANKVLVTARIPREADLQLSTVNDGEIIISNVSGGMQLENVNGPITATGIGGSVIAETVNGDIDLSFTRINGDNAMALDSMNGNLNLGLPSDAAVQLHIDSSKGEIVSDFEVDVQPSKPTVERKENRGGVEVRVESVIIANINGGGTVIRLKTLNGNIQISNSGG